MSDTTTMLLRKTIDDLYRRESRRVLARLIRLLGDFDLAEVALHEAFRAAIELWPREGLPTTAALIVIARRLVRVAFALFKKQIHFNPHRIKIA